MFYLMEKYIDALKTAGMYEGLRWSADRKYKPIHIVLLLLMKNMVMIS